MVDAEARELQLLTDKANVGDIILAAIEKRQTTGETSELQKHYGISSHQIPVEMLRVDRGTEERASATVPDSIGDAVQAEVITPVFSSGDGAFLGIERPTVPVGTRPIQFFPRLRASRVHSRIRPTRRRPTRCFRPTI